MHPQPLFTIGSVPVYLYGICMAVGIIVCFAFLMFTMWKKNFNEEASDKILLIGFVGTGIGIVFAMVFQSIYNYIESGVWDFGESMTFYGGLIGGVVSFLIFWWLYIYVVAPAAKKQAEKWEAEGATPSKFVKTSNKLLQNNMNAGLTDAIPFIPIGICIAHAFGRLGCFFGGCCYGAEADWGLYCAGSYVNGVYDMGPKVVPIQLFEMAVLIVLAAAMAVMYFKFRLNYNLGVYAIVYGIWRFGIEYARDDARGQFVGSITPSQFWSIFMVIGGIAFILLQYFVLSKKMKHPEFQPPVNKKDKGEPETV